MKTKYPNVDLDDLSVEKYGFSRNQFISWADEMCEELRHVLDVVFSQLEPESDEYFFRQEMSGVFCFNKIERRRTIGGDCVYLIVTDKYNLKYELSQYLKYQYNVLLHLQSEIDFSDDPTVDLGRNKEDWDKWVGPLWQDSRDLLQDLLSKEELCDYGAEYTFDNPIVYSRAKYKTLRAVDFDMSWDEMEGYSSFILSSADRKWDYTLDSDSPALIIRIIDAIIKEGQYNFMQPSDESYS